MAAPMRLGALPVGLLLFEEEEVQETAAKRRKKLWMRNWLKDRDIHTQENTMFKLQRRLMVTFFHSQTEDQAEFRVMMRMPPHIYGLLLEKVTPYIVRQDTNYRDAISPDVRLSITLRHLALGDCYASLAHQYRLGRCTVALIVPDTCQGIWDALHEEYISLPCTPEKWLELSTIFEKRWNFPHIIGSVDGKHIRMMAPPKSGSLFFNYHDYFSIVLLAVVDGNYEFIYIDVGAEGRTSDAGLWRQTPFSIALNNGSLNLPPPTPVKGCAGTMPFMVVGDDAFPLGTHVIKPYSHRDLEIRKQVFNYRLSRARRVVENAFGVMASRFTIFHKSITIHPENASKIVQATTVLHNMLRRHCGAGYIPRGSIDQEDDDGNLVEADWRREPLITGIAALQGNHMNNQSACAKKIRDDLSNYFLTQDGAIESQYNNIHV